VRDHLSGERGTLLEPTYRRSMRLCTGTRVPRKQGAPLIRSGSTQTVRSGRSWSSVVMTST
jgi:hypothetical protein